MVVRGLRHLRCPRCGEGLLDLQVVRELERRGAELYRAKLHLLSIAEIRAIRKRHGLSQAELARLLRLGANTISRWEAGRNVQSTAMDVLLRLMRDLPGSLEYLAARAARGERSAFERILREVPSRNPIPGDEWVAPEARAAKKLPVKARRRGKSRRSKR